MGIKIVLSEKELQEKEKQLNKKALLLEKKADILQYKKYSKYITKHNKKHNKYIALAYIYCSLIVSNIIATVIGRFYVINIAQLNMYWGIFNICCMMILTIFTTMLIEKNK